MPPVPTAIRYSATNSGTTASAPFSPPAAGAIGGTNEDAVSSTHPPRYTKLKVTIVR